MIIADITAAELKQRLANNETPIILDVREPWEHEEQNIASAKLIPLGSLPERLHELEDYKDQEILVHCRSGKRSATAQAIMQQQGFTNVRNVVGGMLAYNEA
ncbi:rhodanese-like domain-containing protein [Rufibacter latericius]|uniref:Rhodanese-like domain-containing protein n=1 Tax=Rufibacter latericius TaxID=2487040 RepID=A0A3M9MDF7_9BACT|nr:rhodanese-like domain-containing protein [Rufibacter latericius]RNI22628.1 rhodanese-like domain-containing protein [Rufibacter latericius]